MSEWISVKERLPKDHPDRAYLVVYQNGPHRTPRGVKGVKRNVRVIRFAIYSGGLWRFIAHSDKSRLPERVTHWMHKPKLPRKAPHQPIASETLHG